MPGRETGKNRATGGCPFLAACTAKDSIFSYQAKPSAVTIHGLWSLIMETRETASYDRRCLSDPLERPASIRSTFQYPSLPLKQILVLGAGQSSSFLISHLLELADEKHWFVQVGDLDLELARQRIDGHHHGTALKFDINDASLRSPLVEQADVVINMLPPAFQGLIALECVQHGTHMISVSYRDQAIRDLEPDALRKGVLLLCELGLDPGIDYMSAMALIQRIRGEGGKIEAFCSYGSGIPAPDQEHNPLKYVVTWNPRNVAMGGEEGAQYMERGKIKLVPHHNVFHHTWSVEVEGIGLLEAYANRDSMAYLENFGLEGVQTMIRGTLRYPGWSETWSQIVALGLPNETLKIPRLAQRTYREVTEMFLPLNITESSVEQRTARFLGISPTGIIMDKLRWFGLFCDEPIGCRGETAAAMLVHMLQTRLRLESGDRDMVVLVHELDVSYPDGSKPPERVTSTLTAVGQPGGFTAMSRTVGLPTAIAARLLLEDKLSLIGCQIPTHPSIYQPVLSELAAAGLAFTEQVTPLTPDS